jgi:hypothetical protein
MTARDVQTQDYQCTIAARISPAEAFEGIARPGHRMVKRDFTGRDRKAGDTFTVRFGKTFVDFKIAEAIAPTHAVWQLTDSNLEWLQDKKEWTGMTVVWDISSDDGGTTQVRMTHVGLVPRDRVLQRVQAGLGLLRRTKPAKTAGRGHRPAGSGEQIACIHRRNQTSGRRRNCAPIRTASAPREE